MFQKKTALSLSEYIEFNMQQTISHPELHIRCRN